jgi:hypothetical protein
MSFKLFGSTVLLLSALLLFALPGHSQPQIPVEPDEETRLDEIYDHETSLVMFLYSLQGNDTVDHPLFYWWNHTMWNDPQQDGVNGNELLYKEETEFDISRYKPCLFNGQPC